LQIGNHPARFSREGSLLPWRAPAAILRSEMKFYKRCPLEGRYPTAVSYTFLDGKLQPTKRKDSIPAMQCATGILSYLGFQRWSHPTDTAFVDRARLYADYLIDQALTPDEGEYPRFPRSTGIGGACPQPPDCGRQADRPYEIEPDKGGMAGYALLELYSACHDRKYLETAGGIASVLARHMGPGSDHSSPFPFRADYRTGEGRGDVSADMVSILRLFDGLAVLGDHRFDEQQKALWAWIKDYQIPSVSRRNAGRLWVNFHEDYALPNNRNAWSPLNLAHYILERRERLDPDWRADALKLIEFVNENFVTVRSGVAVCGEQDDDKNPWGGVLGNYVGTLALYGSATGDPTYKETAKRALTYLLYAVDSDGCPGQTALYAVRGGWQEDAHTDVVHGVIDAFLAYPELARG
jgi:hypothetical protein